MPEPLFPNLERKPRFLVVDDEDSMRNQMRHLGTELGFEVHDAFDGIDGIENFQALQPDIVILDLYMPRMNGIAALQKMKEIDESCPVILFTGFLTMDQLVNRGGVAANAYFTKPFKIEELIAKIRELVSQRFGIELEKTEA